MTLNDGPIQFLAANWIIRLIPLMRAFENTCKCQRDFGNKHGWCLHCKDHILKYLLDNDFSADMFPLLKESGTKMCFPFQPT